MEEKPLYLGTNIDTRRLAYITDTQRSTHMQVIGSTGTGKSKFLEHLIREDIKAGSGLCLIDPHGYLVEDLLKWLQAIDWPTDKIILFDPSDEQYVTGFNPLRFSDKDLSYQVDAMVRACAQVWGGEDTDRTPLLKRCLRITFHVLAERGLTLLESLYLTSPTNKLAREFLASAIHDPVIKEQWDYFNSPKMTPKLFYDEFGSTINRLMEFLAAERIRTIIGQAEKPLDLKTIMDEGYVLLVNLSTGKSISHDNAQLLGALIVNDFFLHATQRAPKSRPFYMYIDECGLFVNKDIARILDEGRKFGLHLILAHQHLAQLKKAGEDVYYSVMTDAKTKVVFGGLSTDDAKILAEQMFLGELNLDEYKHSLDAPTVVGYTTTWLKNFSQGTAQGTVNTVTDTLSASSGWTRGENHAESRIENQGLGSSNSRTINIENNLSPVEISYALSYGETENSSFGRSHLRGYSESYAEQSGTAHAESLGETYTESFQEGKSEALMPILESRPTATYSLQDQIWKAMSTLVNQQTRCAIAKLPGLFTKRIIVPFVQEYPTSNKDTIPFYQELCNQDSLFHKSKAQALEEIRRRDQGLKEEIERRLQEKLAEPQQFKQPKASAKKPAGQKKQSPTPGAPPQQRSHSQASGPPEQAATADTPEKDLLAEEGGPVSAAEQTPEAPGEGNVSNDPPTKKKKQKPFV
jgi:hypothetical protein